MKQVTISNEKLAQIIHMELVSRDLQNSDADEIYETISNQAGYVQIRETKGVTFEEVSK